MVLPETSAAGVVRDWLNDWQPEVALVLGSGLGALADRLGDARRLGYGRIPGFELPGVEGHRGELVAGHLAGRRVLVQSGRFHGYEGHPPDRVAGPVRLYAELGAGTLLLTNAAGGIAPECLPGSLMLIADHLNLSFANPLVGPVQGTETRFPDMSGPYDPRLRRLTREVAQAERIGLVEGVYAGVAGPSYESRAEIAMLRRLGADAVGMSTVAEVIVARALGLACLGISVITNRAAGLAAGRLSHQEVVGAARAAEERLTRLLIGVIGRV